MISSRRRPAGCRLTAGYAVAVTLATRLDAVAEPIRMCAGCRGREPKTALVRLAWDASAGLVVDAAQRLPGRGVYLHPGCLGRAVKTRAIGRGLRREVSAAAALALASELALAPELAATRR